MFIHFLSLTVGQDFTLSRTEVTFDLGANDGNTITVFVNVLDDLLVEGTECFTLSGAISTTTAAPGSIFVGGPVTVCIADNDCKFVCGCSFHILVLFASTVFLRINTAIE